MMRLLLAGLAVLFGGCLSQPNAPEPALYDLGTTPAAAATGLTTSTTLAPMHVRSTARSWLDHTAMHYRLAYVDDMRTLSYAYARWIAPPAELVAQRLRHKLVESGARGSIRTTRVRELDIELQEYIQVFDTPTRSVGRVSVDVRLSDDSAGEARFTEVAAAPTPDAAGGVRALSAATDALVERIVDWIGTRGEQEAGTEIGRARPAAK
jgi:cholesterol transport system auxiliary component